MTARPAVVAVVAFAVWALARVSRRRAARRLPGDGPAVPAIGAAVPAIGVAGRHLLDRLRRARDQRRFDERLPDVVAAVARGLRSGASLRAALTEAAVDAPAPIAGALGEVLATAGAGVPLADALDEWGRRCPRPNVLLVVAALTLAHDTGGASAQAVDGVAATLRRRQAARAEAAALATQARLSAYVLAGAPLVVCLFTLVTGGGPARFLLGTPAGLACLASGLGLEAAGAWWMARLARLGSVRRAT